MTHIAASDLRTALAGLAKVVSPKSPLDALRCLQVDVTPERTTLRGTDLNLHATVSFAGVPDGPASRFLVPFDRLQAFVRRLPASASVGLQSGRMACELASGTVIESFEPPKLEEFVEEPRISGDPAPVSAPFERHFSEAMACSSTDTTRYVLNGIHLDVSDPASHYMVGTDGRHLFSANSVTLPIPKSVIVPNHKFLKWNALKGGPWALGVEETKDAVFVQIQAGDWKVIMRAVDGTYPNWRQVIPRQADAKTVLTFPEEHAYAQIVNGLPGGDLTDKPVNISTHGREVFVSDPAGESVIQLVGARAEGDEISIRLNRDYLLKAFACELTTVLLVDAMSPLHFLKEGRQLVVMPLRATAPAPESASPETEETSTPAPNEPQPERKPMTETNGHTTSGATAPHVNGAQRSTTPAQQAPSAPEKPAIEAAIDRLDAFKATFREALIGVTEITTLLRQAVRDQRAGEKEIHQVRQTLRSLQSVKL